MDGFLKSYNSTSGRLLFITLCVMIISFPVSIAINSITVGLLVLIFLLEFRKIKENWKFFISQKQNVLLVILFLSMLISLFQTENISKGMNQLLHASVLVVLPITLTPLRTFNEKSIRSLERLHIIVCVLASFYCLVMAALDSGLIDGSYIENAGQAGRLTYLVHQFTYHNLSQKVHLHAIYFSFFIAIAMFFTVKEFTTAVSRRKLIAVLVFVFLGIVMFLLTSVVMHFALYSFLLFYFYQTLSFKKNSDFLIFYVLGILFSLIVLYQFVLKYTSSYTSNVYLFQDIRLNYYFIIVPAVTFLAMLAAVYLKPFFIKKPEYLTWLLILMTVILVFAVFKYFLKDNYIEKEHGLGVNNIKARNGNWTGAWLVIRDHPVSGVGPGDELPELIQKYKSINFITGVQNQFNVHNQYLEFWVGSGIVAFLSFILLIIYLLYYAYVNRNYSLLCLVYIFAVFCLTESTMYRQPGRNFFIFFMCLLIYGNLPGRDQPNKLTSP